MATNVVQIAAVKNAKKLGNVIKNKEKIWVGNFVQDVKERKGRFAVTVVMTACESFHALTAAGPVLWFARAAMERAASM